MEQQPETKERGTGRVEAFSDGVFAVAITLLVLDIHVPQLDTPFVAALADALRHDWPSAIAFITSFATILIMWINHHRLFAAIPRSTTRLLYVNGLLLLLVTAVPFPTAMLARYLTTPAAALAAAVYAGLFALIDLAYAAIWRVGGTGRTARRTLSDSVALYIVGFSLYLIATVTAFWNAYVSLAICAALWILWAIIGAVGGSTVADI